MAVLAGMLAACGGERLTDHVDPFIGTGAHGHTYPGATVPFGMVQLSPDNGQSGWDWSSGYHYSDSVIVGFSHTHLSGTGIGDLCDVLVMPVVGATDLTTPWRARDDRTYASRFSHERESASPGYYAVHLDGSGVDVELTATARAGMHRYTFPDTGDAGVLIDLGYAVNWDRPTESYLAVEGDTAVVGYRYSTGWARDQRVFFVAVFDRPIVEYALVGDAAATPDSGAAVHGPRARGAFRFGRGAGRRVQLKVGISYVDLDGARRNLAAEIPHWGFDRVRRAARDQWEQALHGIRIETADPALARTFYTALYHTKLAPVRFDDVDGRYRGGDGAIHEVEGFANYSIYSLWDTFRAAHPLYTLTERERVDDLARSMLAFARESGLLPVWSLVGNETNTMTGYHAIPVLADAYRKGFRGFDAEEAFQAMKRSAMQDDRGLAEYRRYGYIPSELEVESVTKTLEYAYDDWAIAEMAAGLGHGDDAARFRERARSYTRVFDPGTRFMRGRDARGRWVEPFDPVRSSHRERTDYTEGNAWQHSWFVPHDVRGLIELMGGEGRFVRKLDSLFAADTAVTGERVSPDISGMLGQYAHGNEPSHHIAYLYSYAGAPWKTQETARRILSDLYRDTPDGLPGNEDCGQLSAWYVFSAMGFYPVNPADGVYVIGSPLFGRVSLDLGAGRRFTVIAEDASPENRYVQSARLNGQPHELAYLRHEDIVRGGTLRLEMGPGPNVAWAADLGARPPSMSDPVDRAALATAAREATRDAWEAYRRYAWGHDQLRPLSRGFRDWYGVSLQMTPLDAFDTMLLMGLEREAEAAKGLVLGRLSFDHDVSVQVFEVTIRLLGGLISAYQMDGDERFLRLARDLADRLMPAFGSPTGMPYVRVNLRTGARTEPVNNPAEIGTLMLEFGALSKLTGDPKYYDAAKRGIVAVYDRRSPIGLVGTTIDVETGEWRDTTSHVSGRIDSYYEYLLKAWLLFQDEDFRRMWETSVTALNEHVADERPDGLWYARVGMASGARVATRFGALDAFLPAVLALGGDTARAEALMASVYRMWAPEGIEPEQLDYTTMEIRYPQYVLRPEAIESAYYLHRITGEDLYLRMGRTMFERVLGRTRVPGGFAALASVVTGEPDDQMESFFLAETLKYGYLLFADPAVLEFGSVVFNTEAHPIRRTW
jgi:predicted alpha-1,2-mannosidase